PMNPLRFRPLCHFIPRRLAVAGLAAALGWLAAGKGFAGGGPQNVLVVVNGSSQSSLEVANEYQRLRNIPERNVFYLQASNTAAFYTGGDLRRIMTGASFRTNCLWPVLSYIRANGMTNHIDYILYSTDIPTQIDVTSETNSSYNIAYHISGTAYFSITAMTQFGDLVEPVNTASNLAGAWVSCFRDNVYHSNSPATFTTNFTHATVWGTNNSLPERYYISTVLGWTHWFGNTTEELKNYLARSRNADGTRPTGTVYLDANTDIRGLTRSDQFSSASDELTELGIASIIISNNPSPYSITNKPDILGAMMGAAAPEVPAGSYYLPGSIAESLTSWSGIMDNTGIGQFRMSQHLGVGVAGTSGTVTEPYAIPSKFPGARIHAHYARGATMGEAFQFSVWQPYHLLIMGDALCRPGAIIPTVTLTNLAEGDVVTGSRTLFPGASTTFSNGLAGFDLFLDGLPWQTAPTNGSVTLNTTTLSDGGHELRVIAYENSAIRTQGDRVVNFRVNNFAEQLLFDSTNYTSTVGGTNILLTVTRMGAGAGQVDLWKGPIRLGSLSGTSSNASISVTNFGPGRSILRATMAMTSGNVRSEPIVVDVLPAADSTPPTIARFSIQTGTNNQMQGLSSKPAYRSGDYIYLSIVPSEPI
ncbi:MAG: TIGR03790 family protein, partial [Verrucomicrobiota bacterium]